MYLAVFWCIVGSERLCLIFFSFLLLQINVLFFSNHVQYNSSAMVYCGLCTGVLIFCFLSKPYAILFKPCIIAMLWSTVLCCFFLTMCIEYRYSRVIVYCCSCTVVSTMVSCLDRMPRYHLHGLSDCNGTVTWDERRDNCTLKFLVCCTQYKHAVKCIPICALNKTYINLISYNLFMCLHI